MPVERTSGGTSLIDVLDRVLDKGIVIDAWVRLSLVGIDLITVEARIVVASIATYLQYSVADGETSRMPSAQPAASAGGCPSSPDRDRSQPDRAWPGSCSSWPGSSPACTSISASSSAASPTWR